ncbi:MAG: hypothetical protein WAV84_12020 [Bacteroidota bacterium]
MSLLRQISLILFSVVVLSACSEDDPTLVIHHVNPLWTPDGKTIVAGYDEYVPVTGDAIAALRMAPSRLQIMDFATRAKRVIDLVGVSTWHSIYAFDPSGTALCFAQHGEIIFYDLQGLQLLKYAPTSGGDPRHLAFSNTGNSFVWIGTTSSGYTVNLTTYDGVNWTILDTTPLLSVETTEAVLSLVLTSQRSFAVRMNSGIVKEIDFNGTELNSFSIAELQTDNPWHARLVYYTARGGRYLYAIDANGMMRMDLSSGTSNLLVGGTLIDFDVSDKRESMLYETTTGDIWLSNPDGNPLSRIAPQNLMPRFSPAANGIALVARVDTYVDSLHILLLR